MPIILGRKPGGSGGGGAPSGPAGGDLGGTYPNPTVSAGASADGTVLTSDGAGGTDWELPIGTLIAYTQITAPVTVSGTSSGTANAVVSSGAVAYAALPTKIEFFAPWLVVAGTSGSAIVIDLFDDATSIGILATSGHSSGTQPMQVPFYGVWYLTPSAATHTYNIKAWRTIANGQVGAGVGGSATDLPAYIRISRA